MPTFTETTWHFRAPVPHAACHSATLHFPRGPVAFSCVGPASRLAVIRSRFAAHVCASRPSLAGAGQPRQDVQQGGWVRGDLLQVQVRAPLMPHRQESKPDNKPNANTLCKAPAHPLYIVRPGTQVLEHEGLTASPRQQAYRGCPPQASITTSTGAQWGPCTPIVGPTPRQSAPQARCRSAAITHGRPPHIGNECTIGRGTRPVAPHTASRVRHPRNRPRAHPPVFEYHSDASTALQQARARNFQTRTLHP